MHATNRKYSHAVSSYSSDTLRASHDDIRQPSKSLSRTALRIGVSAPALACLATAALVALPVPAAHAQSVVSACSGVSLPRSVVTDIAGQVLVPVITPLQNLLGTLTFGTVNLGLAGSLANAAAGAPISLNALDINGNAIDLLTNPGCVTQSDSFQLATPAGLAFGGNQITGLGTAGRVASAAEVNAIAIGDDANTGIGATGAIAIGDSASVTHVGALGSVALGQNSLATGATLGTQAYLVGGTAPAEVNIGGRRLTGLAAGAMDDDAASVGQLRAAAAAVADDALMYDIGTGTYSALRGGVAQRITGVADGTLGAGSTDAVNGAQLGATNDAVTANTSSITMLGGSVTSLNASVGDLQANALLYDGTLGAYDASQGGIAQRITNVADGALGAGSTDAVNGAQLGATNDAVTANATSITTLNTNVAGLQANALLYDGTLGAYDASQGGIAQRIANVADGALGAGSTDAVNGAQLGATNDAVTLNTTNIASLGGSVTTLNTSVSTLQADALLYDGGLGAFSAARGGVAQRLTNLAAGTIGATSSDAVNGGQLFSLGTSLAASLGGSSAYDPATGLVSAGISYDGLTFDSVQGALSAIENSIGGMALTAADARFFNVNSTGTDSQALGTDSTAIGPNAVANANGAIAAGRNASVTGAGSVALGTDAQAPADSSVALGSASSAARGGVTGYVAFGTTGAQTSVGEIAVGRSLVTLDPITGLPLATGSRQVTGVAAGSADTDAVNVAQLRGVSSSLGTAIAASLGGGASYSLATGAVTGPTYVVNGATYASVGDALAGISGTVNAVASTSVAYDTTARDRVTLGGAAGTTVTNVAAGTLAAGSTDAVNGGQLFATNQQVTANTNAISTLANNIVGSTMTPVQYSNPGTPTASNGGVMTNDVTLVGANPAAPVGLHNVAAGNMAAGSTDAVNGGQLNAVSQTANQALGLGQNAVQYDAGGASVSLASINGVPVALHNVAAGTATNDAVNYGQLNAGVDRAINTANAYTDTRLARISYDIADVRRDASGGTAAAMAMATIPQAYGPGMSMAGMGVSTWRGESAVAFGLSRSSGDGNIVVKLGATYNTRGQGGAAGGIGFGF
jgi:autotransporter adhesin